MKRSNQMLDEHLGAIRENKIILQRFDKILSDRAISTRAEGIRSLIRDAVKNPDKFDVGVKISEE